MMGRSIVGRSGSVGTVALLENQQFGLGGDLFFIHHTPAVSWVRGTILTSSTLHDVLRSTLVPAWNAIAGGGYVGVHARDWRAKRLFELQKHSLRKTYILFCSLVCCTHAPFP